MLKIRAFFVWLTRYRIPYLYNHYIKHMEVSEKGEKLLVFCADIIANGREAQDYTEVVLEKQIQAIRTRHQWSREQAARCIFLQLLALQPVSFKEFWSIIKH